VRRLVRATAILGLGSAATVAAAIIRAKILAARLGPEGTGVLAQLGGLTAVLVPFATLGAGNGVISLIAEARGRGDLARVRRITNTAIHLAWGLGLAFAVITAAASPWIAQGIYRDRAFAWAIILGAITVPLSAVASLRIAMLQGHEAVRSMAALNAIVALFGIVTIVPMAWIFGVKGAVAQLVLIALAQVWLSRRFLRPLTPAAAVGAVGGRVPGEVDRRSVTPSPGALPPAVPEVREPREPRIDRTLLAPIARYGGSALLVGLSSTLTLLVLRSILVQKLGIAQNGIYQVCVGVSGLTMPLILNSISATVWPEIASKRNDPDTIAAMSGAIRLGFLLVTALCASLLVGAPIWVPLFYSHKFAGALDLLPFQFLGDYFRTGAWTFGIWLVPRERLRPWVLFDVIYGVVLLLAFLLLVDHVGLKSVVFAYVAAHVSHAVLHYVLARRALGFRLGRDNTILLGASFALLLGLTIARPKDWIGVVLGGIAVLAWAAIVVKRREWLTLRQMAGRVLGLPTAAS